MVRFEEWPFHVGATNESTNPASLPSTLPLELAFCERTCRVVQSVFPELLSSLKQVYEIGLGFGTPLSNSPQSKPYADDFLAFCEKYWDLGGQTLGSLEIGAGTGYLSSRLREAGLPITSLEPGRGFETDWARWEVKAIRDFFPSPLAPPPYENIFAYGVLEHVPDPIGFLHEVRNHLIASGKAFFSVPDCTVELISGDPAALVHEHFSYFDSGSLYRLFSEAGMAARITQSGFGRTLYVVATKAGHEHGQPRDQVPMKGLRSFGAKAKENYLETRAFIESLTGSGSLGLYAPVRGLPYISKSLPVRLFDDDPLLQGRFLPPLSSQIESRQGLINNPPDSLILCSRTFDDRIRGELTASGYSGSVFSLHELLHS